jgi:hypothetical protein
LSPRSDSQASKLICRNPENCDLAEREVKTTGNVRDLENQPLTFKRLAIECERRRQAIENLNKAPRGALGEFASFIRSQPVTDRLLRVKDQPKAVSEALEAGSHEELADMLATMPDQDLKSLAKILAAALGDKSAKTVVLDDFKPQNEFLWEPSDIDAVSRQFRDFLRQQWEEGRYLKLQRGTS